MTAVWRIGNGHARAQRRSRQAELALTLIVAFAGGACRDHSSPSAAASASSSQPPPCREAPSSDYERRCERGERECCALFIAGRVLDEDARSHYDFAMACRSGDLRACGELHQASQMTVSDVAAAFEGACAATRDEVTCRSAAVLGCILTPGAVAEHVGEYCARTGRAELALGGSSLPCPGGGPALETLRSDASACGDGRFERCEKLVAPNSGDMWLVRRAAQEAWQRRGFDESQALAIVQGPARRVDLAAVTPRGDVAVHVSPSDRFAPLADVAALRSTLDARVEDVRRCIARATPGPHLLGRQVDLSFEAVVAEDGTLVAAIRPHIDPVPAELRSGSAEGLIECVRGVVQDAPVERTGRAGEAHVVLGLRL